MELFFLFKSLGSTLRMLFWLLVVLGRILILLAKAPFYLWKCWKLRHSLNADKEAINFNSLDAQAYHRRGRTDAELGRHGRSNKDHDEAIRIHPRLLFAYTDRSLAHAHRGDAKKADSYAEKAVELGADRTILAEEVYRPPDTGFTSLTGLAKKRRATPVLFAATPLPAVGRCTTTIWFNRNCRAYPEAATMGPEKAVEERHGDGIYSSI